MLTAGWTREALQALFGVDRRILRDDRDEIDAVQTEADDVKRAIASVRNSQRYAHGVRIVAERGTSTIP